MSEALARIGDADDAGAALERWDREARGLFPLTSWFRRWAGAALLQAQGENDGSAALLETLEKDARKMEMTSELLWVRMDLGSAVLPRDRELRPAFSPAWLKRPRRSAQLVSIGWRCSRLDSRRRAWRRSPPREGVRPESLSDREME